MIEKQSKKNYSQQVQIEGFNMIILAKNGSHVACDFSQLDYYQDSQVSVCSLINTSVYDYTRMQHG